MSTIKATSAITGLLDNLGNKNLVDWMNGPKTNITMRIVQMSSAYRERSVVVELTLYTLTSKKEYRNTYLVRAKMSKHLYNWFHNNQAKDDNGNYTKTVLAPYQKYLQTRGIPVETNIKDIEFSCDNDSEDYYACPFRLKFNKEYGTATMYNVQEPNYYRSVKHNPSDPMNPIVRLYQPKDPATGYVRNRSRANYRRVEVQ